MRDYENPSVDFNMFRFVILHSRAEYNAGISNRFVCEWSVFDGEIEGYEKISRSNQ